jgi:hypothetical protein
MRMVSSMQTARSRAAEALKAVLHQVSQVRLRDIELPNPDLKIDIVARIDVHGRRRTLICGVRASGRPEHILVAIDQLQSFASQFDGVATPLIIAPHLTDQAKALCGENRTGFLDFNGNARIDLGEVFIFRRMLPQSDRSHAASLTRTDGEGLFGAA